MLLGNRRESSVLLHALLLALTASLCLSVSAGDKKPAPGTVLVSDKGKFNILLDGKSVGREEFEIQPAGASWIAKGVTSLQTPDGKSAKVTGTLTLQSDGVPVAYDWTSQTDKANSANIVFVNGVAKTTLQMEGARPFQQENSFGSSLIAVLDNNLYHQYEIVARVYNWSKRGQQTFPVLVPQDLTPGTITVDSPGPATAGGKSYESLKVSTSDLEVVLYLDATHRLMRLEVPAAKVAVLRE